MSVKKFIISTSAKWFDIFALIIFNIISVPLIITKWSIETYGAWIVLIGVISYISIPYSGLHQYIYSKNLQLGKKKKKEISKNIISSLPFTLLISLVIVFLLAIELNYQFLTNSLNITDSLKKEWTLALFLFGIYSLLTYSVIPFYTQALSIFGYLPFFMWSGSIRSMIVNISYILGIYAYDVSLVIATTLYLIAGIIFHLLELIFIYIYIKKEQIKFESLNLRNGFNNFLKSIWISAAYIVESTGTQGLRLIISTLANPATLVIFTTIRTIANIFNQILETIRIPFLIEIMNHISNKNSKKINKNFELYYIFISIIIFPSVIILQFFIEDMYNVWTLGKVKFNFETYTILIMAVLISCIGFPYRVIITGNNIIKSKLGITLIKSLFLILFIFIFYGKIKILSFSIAIFLSELIEFLFNYFIIDNFFKKKKFTYNKKIFLTVIINLLLCFIIFIVYSISRTSITNYNFLITACIIIYLINTLIMFRVLSIDTILIFKKIRQR